jgi:NADH dehydrogenase
MNNQALFQERNHQVVVIDGASGYMGSHITSELRQLGYTVRCVVRLKASEEDVRMLEKTGAEVYRANLGAPESQEVLRKAFEGAGCAIHTIGTVSPRKGETLSDLHIHQTASFVNTCERNKVGKMIMISSLGTRAGASANYHQTKWLAEEILRKQQIPYLILRPSFVVGKVFGRRNSKLVDRYLNLIKEKTVVPLIAGGGNMIQPIFISDLVKAVVEGVSRSASDLEVFGRTLEIAGPEQMTMRQFVERLALEVVGQKRTYKTISPALAGFAAIFCELAQDVPMVSSDQVKLAQENMVCLDNALESVFQIKPTELSAALLSYKDEGRVPKQGTPQQVS